MYALLAPKKVKEEAYEELDQIIEKLGTPLTEEEEAKKASFLERVEVEKAKGRELEEAKEKEAKERSAGGFLGLGAADTRASTSGDDIKAAAEDEEDEDQTLRCEIDPEEVELDGDENNQNRKMTNLALERLREALEASPRAAGISELSLNNFTHVTEKGWISFVPCLNLATSLTELHIAGSSGEENSTQIKNTACIAMCQALSETVAPMQELWVAFNFIGDEGAKAIAKMISAKPHFTTLDLQSNVVGDDGTKELAAVMARHEKFDTLYLEDNLVGDPGAKGLAKAIAKLTRKVETLVLTNNNIGDSGAKALAKAIEANSKGWVDRIDLTQNNVSDEGCLALLGALKAREKDEHKDRRINLSNCNVSLGIKVGAALAFAEGVAVWGHAASVGWGAETGRTGRAVL